MAVAGLLLELGVLRWLCPSTTEYVTRREPFAVIYLSYKRKLVMAYALHVAF